MKPDIKNSGIEVRILYMLLMRSDRYSYLPDLFEHLGEDVEKMTNLLVEFAGRTISFPYIAELEKFSVDIEIYSRLKGKIGAAIALEVSKLAKRLDMAESLVESKFRNMKKIIKETGLDFGR